MQPRLFHHILVGLVVLLAACSTPPASLTPQVTLLPTISPATITLPPPSPKSMATETLSPTPAVAVPDIPRMTFDVLVNYNQHRADVKETIVYPNHTSDPLTFLVLAVEPNFWQGAFNLNFATVDGVPVIPSLTEQRMEIQLPQMLEPGNMTTLSFQYTLNLPVLNTPGEGQKNLTTFGYSSRQLNLAQWYPFVVPYLPGEGWVLHEPWFSGEHLVHGMADYTVYLHFSDPVNPPVVAASGEEVRSPQVEPVSNFLHYQLKQGRAFAISISPDYVVSEQQAGDVLVRSYYFPEHLAAGQAVLKASAQAVQVYTDKFGPPPHPTLSAVEGDFEDGMEFSGLYFLSRDYYARYDDTPQNYATLLAAHETAHQWWFERVANDQATEPWLDEALSTYSEHVFIESIYPDLVDWWWSYRVDSYNPKGWVDTSIYGGGKFRPYINAVYLQGARFIQSLRDRMGEEAFFAFLRDYYSQMGGKISTKENFLTILRQHTSTDVSDIIAEYFQDPR